MCGTVHSAIIVVNALFAIYLRFEGRPSGPVEPKTRQRHLRGVGASALELLALLSPREHSRAGEALRHRGRWSPYRNESTNTAPTAKLRQCVSRASVRTSVRIFGPRGGQSCDEHSRVFAGLFLYAALCRLTLSRLSRSA